MASLHDKLDDIIIQNGKQWTATQVNKTRIEGLMTRVKYIYGVIAAVIAGLLVNFFKGGG
jgi:hypothetical protein